MDKNERKELMLKSNISKKVEKVLEFKEDFQNRIRKQLENIAQDTTNTGGEQIKDESSDMVVCVRIRPRHQEEIDLEYFDVVHSINNNEVNVFDPAFDVRGKVKLATSNFKVDHAFGPKKDNAAVYSTLGPDLVDLSLQGGICSLLSYGQTGAGKTFTMNGMLEFLAQDLFDRQQYCKGKINLYFSCFEILGDCLTDLLKPELADNEEKPTKSLEILEDKFGKMQVKGAVEILIDAPDHLKSVISSAAGYRKTTTTFKNDNSSRSHAVYRIRTENEMFPAAENGQLFVIDLAGAENSSDSQFHDKERIKETMCINTSLSALKDCIINRAKATANTSKHFHIPFRASKLTLLLKDAFQLESHKICKTIVFANVMPTFVDNSMTLNTLRYVAPIKEGMKNKTKVEPDPKNPMHWDNDQLRDWFHVTSKGLVDAKIMCPYETGRQILRIPEVEFLGRLMASNPDIGDKRAKAIYDKLWAKLIDARVADRKKKSAMATKKNLQSIEENNKLRDEDKEYVKTKDSNIYQEIIDDNLLFKGISPVVILDKELKVLAKHEYSENITPELNDALTAMKNIEDDAALDVIFFSGVEFTKLESSTAACWKGQAKIGTGILGVYMLENLWILASSKKLKHFTLEKFISAPIEKLQTYSIGQKL